MTPLVFWIIFVSSSAQELVELSEDQKDKCIAGYFEYTSGELTADCCRYYQCVADGDSAYVRTCMAPLVWNVKTCACDHRMFRPECVDTPDTCYTEEPRIADECPEKDLSTDECCRNNLIYTGVDDGLGFLRSDEATPQLCPKGTLFSTETCNCDNEVKESEGECTNCMHFSFDMDFKENIQGVWLERGDLVFGSGGVLNSTGFAKIRKPSGTAGFIPYFAKAHLGTNMTISAWYRTSTHTGYLIDNKPPDGESTIEILMDAFETVHREGRQTGLQQQQHSQGNGAKITIGDVTAMLNLPDVLQVVRLNDNNDEDDEDAIIVESLNGEKWHNIIVVMKDLELVIYLDGQAITAPQTIGAEIKGTGHPLYIGRGYPGHLDELIYCRSPWTTEEISDYYNNGIIPDSDS